MLENLALRQQLAVLTRQRARTRTKPADRLFWSWLSRYWPGRRSTLVIVQPEDGHPLAPHGVARVLDVEEPSPTAGPAAYQQRAARAHREDRNREPAPGRRPHPGRATRARLRGERGDVRCYRRRALRRPPSQSWRTFLTAVRAPKANAIAERVVGTLRRECLDHLIIVNERHLRLVLREYVAHYNHVRPHQALELWAPDDRRPRSPPRSEGQVVGRPILGGLHHEYERLAA